MTDLRRSLFQGGLINRRSALTAALGGAALAGAGPAVQSRSGPPQAQEASSFDWQSPAENLRMLSRMWGTVEEGEEAFLYVFGPAFGLLDAENYVPLFRLESLANVRTYTLPNGAFHYLANQVILFCDYFTNEVLETWDNPYTGETVDVFQYRDGPLDYKLDPNAFPERYKMEGQDALKRKLVLDWWFRGDTAYGDAIARTSLPNKLDPAVWKRESIGPRWETFEAYRWQAKIEEMEDLSLPSVPSFTGDFQTFKPWEPWMLMGQTPGKIFSVRTAFKPKTLDDVPRHVINYIEKNLPEFMSAPTTFHGEYKLNDAHFKALRTPSDRPLPALKRP
ncbi:MAG: DUF1838 family protein [Pseudomonadota bacterium]